MKQSFLEVVYDIATQTKQESPAKVLKSISAFMFEYADTALNPKAWQNLGATANAGHANINKEENVLCVQQYAQTGGSITKCSIHDLAEGRSLELTLQNNRLGVDLQDNLPKKKVKELTDFYLK